MNVTEMGKMGNTGDVNPTPLWECTSRCQIRHHAGEITRADYCPACRAWDAAFQQAIAEATNEIDLGRRIGHLARHRPAENADEEGDDEVLGRVFWPYAAQRPVGDDPGGEWRYATETIRSSKLNPGGKSQALDILNLLRHSGADVAEVVEDVADRLAELWCAGWVAGAARATEALERPAGKGEIR